MSQNTNTNSILLLHNHLTPTPNNQALHKAIQKITSESYRETHSTRADILGTSFTRLPDPNQIADTIGEDGFTIALVRTPSNTTIDTDTTLGIEATGLARIFKHPEAETHEQWIAALKSGTAGSAASASLKTGPADGTRAVKYEVTAFAVSPDVQAGGLGARVLRELEWLVTRIPISGGLRQWFGGATPTVGPNGIDGIDLDQVIAQRNDKVERTEDKSQLVLMGIQELGNEAYYQRRGFRTMWAGVVPVGTWYSLKECTAVYMEKPM